MSVKNNNNNAAGGGEIIRAGLLKKLKTAKRKWFVLRAETPDASARLEYYDSEKKFHNGVPPKRSIPLKTCFNINRRFDTKHKHVIALYTKDDRFCIVLESEEELDAWLKALLSLQFPGMETPDGEMPRPNFEHVWQVTILNRGLGTGRTGNYRLCLTDKTLTLIRKDGNHSVIDLNLSNIRSCGSLKNYFFLEIGRSSQLGAGELWMESEDTNIAQNIHLTIYHAMSSNTTNKEKDDLGPKTRNRSSSDTSKPNNVCRKPGNVTKPHVFSQEQHVTSCSSNSNTAAITPHLHPPTASGGLPCPGTTTISHQRTQSLPLTDHSAPITDNTPIHPTTTTTTTTISTARTANKRPNQSTAKSISGMRDRSDSVPSRPRTTSEGTHPMSTWRHGLTPHRSHGRDISHSPTSGSPVSPPSVGCSTDSTGSSYSLADEPDGYMDCSESIRYPIPLTPDEAIEEEDYPESPCGKHDRYVPMAAQSSDDGYVDMSPRYHPNAHSPTASLSSITSGTPSTDMRFSDYPLDKVTSYLLSEDDEDRPMRAYSVGSRPETFRNRRQMELASAPESSRCRAFSVGSKTKKGPSRVLPPHHPHHGIKSSSAPILSNSRTYSSHSSIGPMDDLMELDFSRSNTGSSTNSGYLEMRPGGSNNNNKTTPSGYVEMKPGVELAAQKKISQSSDVSPYVDMSSSRCSAYVDMSGCSPSRTSNVSPQSECSSFVDINRQYRFTSGDLPRNNNYVDMDNRKNKTVSSPGAFNWNGDDYLDMSVNQQRLSQSSQMSSSPHNSDYMPLDFATGQVKTPEGYVEMSLGNKKHQRQPSLENSINEEYTNMSLGAKKKATKKASQPISISTSGAAAQPAKSSSSPISIGSFLGRKTSVGTSPKMHLPLSWNTSPYSSLPRQKSKKDGQANSKDSSSSSVTTPSSSSTIFPLSLNSPSSPMKPTAKTETPSSLKLPAAIFNAIYRGNSNRASSAKPEDYASMDYETAKTKSKASSSSDYVNYAPAAPSTKAESSDYAVMHPGALETAKATTLPVKSVSSDSASPLIGHLSTIGIKENQSMVFCPIKEDSRTGSTSGNDESRKPEESPQGYHLPESPYEVLRGGDCVSPAAKISRPNSVNGESPKEASQRVGAVADRALQESPPGAARPSSTSSEQWSSSSTVVGGGSRPESANSEAAAAAAQEPNCAAKLHYASLDLAAQPQADAQQQAQPEPTSVYAEIDFIMSEGLKQSNNQSLLNNTKVKH